MSIPFEPTRSYVYKASRYELLPRIADKARSFGDEPFLLRELSKQVLIETYTPDQLELRIKKAQSDETEKMKNIFGFYIPFLAENLRVFERLGGGMFKNISLEEEQAEADAIATDIESDDPGIIYAYSFPSIKKNGGKFPIKVGLTVTAMLQNESSSSASRLAVLNIRSSSRPGRFKGSPLSKVQSIRRWRRAVQNVKRLERNGSTQHLKRLKPSSSSFRKSPNNRVQATSHASLRSACTAPEGEEDEPGVFSDLVIIGI